MKTMRTSGHVLLGIAVCTAPLFTPGCGGGFLGLEDYQRDLLFGGLAVALLLTQPDDTATGTGGASGDGTGAPVPGPDGERGLPGVDGQDGTDGSTGEAGPPGPQGEEGLQGAVGPEGPAGISCWDLNENGRADAEEDVNGDGDVNVADCQGTDGLDGADGIDGSGGGGGQGQEGPAGPQYFDIFIDDFFTSDPDAPGGDLQVNIVRIDEPLLALPDPESGLPGPIAYRVAIPNSYDAGNDVTMRMFFYGDSPCGDCLVFTLDAVRLRDGQDVTAYGGRRWIRPNLATATTPELVVIDLPLNTAAGLGFPNDLVGADFLAFEIAIAQTADDNEFFLANTRLQIIGVSFFESAVGTATANDRVAGGILTEGPTDPCPPAGNEIDCNDNDVSDDCDILEGTSEDCNENGIPDECDLCPYDVSAVASGDTDVATPVTFPDRPTGNTEPISQSEGQVAGITLPTQDLDSGLTPVDLVNALLGVGVSVSNVSYVGANIAAGTFSGGTDIIGFESGVILSSGSVALVSGPQNLDDSTTANNELPGDADLDALLPDFETFDATVLEFDFECEGEQTIQFEYVFTSEEYNEFVDSDFNDVFAFFLNGENIALVPGAGNTPVAINNVNCGNPFDAPDGGTNCNLFRNNDCGLPADFPCTNIETEMDGLTLVFTATGTLLPGVNHIKLAIADAGDEVLDSNVFIRAESFACALPIGACCDTTDFTCRDQVLEEQCQSDGEVWNAGIACDVLDPPCLPTGACCDLQLMSCTDDVPEDTCFGEWTGGTLCSELEEPCELTCSLDCNHDYIPDECQLEGNDCNQNGIPDDCDGGCDKE